MSQILDAAAREDAQRREDLARSDAAQAEFIAADIERNVGKSAKAHARNDACASAADMQWLDAMRCRGAL